MKNVNRNRKPENDWQLNKPHEYWWSSFWDLIGRERKFQNLSNFQNLLTSECLYQKTWILMLLKRIRHLTFMIYTVLLFMKEKVQEEAITYPSLNPPPMNGLNVMTVRLQKQQLKMYLKNKHIYFSISFESLNQMENCLLQLRGKTVFQSKGKKICLQKFH